MRAARALLLASSLLALSACAPGSSDPAADDAAGSESALNSVVDAGTVLRVTASSLNLRSGASTQSSVLDVLANGDLVTVVTKSGGNGWVNVKSAGGDTGWVARQYVVVQSGGSSPQPSGGTCDPNRADGAVNDFEKALHDSIAYAEGTRGYSKDGYNVLFSFKLFQSCAVHPNQCIKFGSSCSTAAGRYQFLTTTWGSVKSAQNLDSFEPENQERGAQYLITSLRHVTVPSSRAMTASEFSNAMSKLSYEWASLPPGRYGQPSKSLTQMRSMYCSLAGC